MILPRRTLKVPAHFSGVGLHSGIPVKVTVHPSSDGIAFRLGSERVVADPANVTDTARRTRLGSVNTVEHLMSAFAGLEITDAEVEVTAPEMPGLDGSSIEFVRGLIAAGIIDGEPFEAAELYRRLFPDTEDSSISIAKGTGHWRYVFETIETWPGMQSFEIASIVDGYAAEVAPARTTVFWHELEMAEKAGLGKGLNIDSVLILDPGGYRNPARFEDEPARHKLLDVAGDLYLAGVPIRTLNVVAVKSGHKANVAAAALLKQALTA